MIKISIDEAYAFDMLAIFEVKISNLSGEKLAKTLEKKANMIEQFVQQIGRDKYNQIISSAEYGKMILANQKVFELIDKSKFDDGLAKVTDDANFERHIAKIALQKKFFDSDLTEFKNRN
jgi:hypothetical protein